MRFIKASIDLVAIAPDDMEELAKILNEHWPDWPTKLRVRTIQAQHVLTERELGMAEDPKMIQAETLKLLRHLLAKDITDKLEPQTTVWDEYPEYLPHEH